MGVAFFSPFWKKRFIFKRGPIKVSPMSVEAFCSNYGIEVLKSEYVYIWGPSR
jgi:inner membrane protein